MPRKQHAVCALRISAASVRGASEARAPRPGFRPARCRVPAWCNGGIRSDRTRGRFHSIRHVRAVAWLLRALAVARQDDIDLLRVSTMGKYFLGWILGVPVFVYLFNF